MKTFNVFVPGVNPKQWQIIDTVYFSDLGGIDEPYVLDSLIKHDGYPADILVKEVK